MSQETTPCKTCRDIQCKGGESCRFFKPTQETTVEETAGYRFVRDFRDWRFKEDRKLPDYEIIAWSQRWWLTELQAHTDRVVEALEKEKVSVPLERSQGYAIGFNNGIDTSIQIVKNTK